MGGPLTHGKSVDPDWLPAKRLLQSRARAGTPAASQSSSLKQTTRSSAETLWALRPPPPLIKVWRIQHPSVEQVDI